jgi:hypothetical protein
MGECSSSLLIIAAAIGQERPTGIPFLLKGGKIQSFHWGEQQEVTVLVGGKEVYQLFASPIQEMDVEDLNNIAASILGENAHLPERLEDSSQNELFQRVLGDVRGGVKLEELRFGFVKGDFDEAERTLALFLMEREAVQTQ